jgi:hypothetical protein
MKYVVTWKPRRNGSQVDNEASSAQLNSLVSKWSPSPSLTIHQVVRRVDGEGGFAVLESDNAGDLADDLFKFRTLFEYTAYPVIDSHGALQHGNHG